MSFRTVWQRRAQVLSKVSAWDVAGAVIWTAVSIRALLELFVFHEVTDSGVGHVYIASISTGFGAVYCWARLFGARMR